MSNLYKGQVNQSREGVYTRLIDYNELLEQKLSALTFEQEAKLRRERMEQLRRQREQAAESGEEVPEGAEDGGPDDAEFEEGLLDARMEDVPPEMEIDYVEQAKEQADQIMAKASADAEEILKRAVQEAENLKESARKQAEEKGYADAMQRVQAEESRIRGELEQMRLDQQQAYEKQLEEMEPKVMDAVIEVFDHVLQSDLAGRRQILLHLIRSTVSHIKNSREFRIRVSGQDYETAAGAKDEILKKIGGDVVLDILLDESMQQGQCTIDTDEGIFDCGLDVQMENLVKDLKALSCMR